MKFKYMGYMAVVGLSFIGQIAFAADTLTYKNARGSTLELQFRPDDTVIGTFTTAVASKGCQQAIGMKRPVIGYTAENSIAFSVNYPECGSVVAFSGNVEGDKKVIDTVSIVTHPSTQASTEGPGARMIGHDVFKRV